VSGAVQSYEMFYEILLVGGEHHVVTMFMMNGFNCVVKIYIYYTSHIKNPVLMMTFFPAALLLWT
jgi:hypothetical protein